METIDIVAERDRMLLSLTNSYSELWKMGKKLAECERDYKIAYRKEVLRLVHDKKCAWTAAITLAQGDTDAFNVAELRFNRDIAKSPYNVSTEKINGLKLSLRIIESEIERQWGKSGKGL